MRQCIAGRSLCPQSRGLRPKASDSDIWIGAIGADGHGRFFLTPRASGCVRPHSYALAIAGGVVAVGCWGSTTVTIRCA